MSDRQIDDRMLDGSSPGAGYRGAPVLVLGAAGFIGRWVVQALVEREAAVVLAVRDRGPVADVAARGDGRAQIVELDLADPGGIRDLVEAVRPAVTFNLSGYGVDPGERNAALSFRLNRDVPEALTTALGLQWEQQWPGAALVHAGSAQEYGAVTGVVTEETAPRPTTVYGRSKLDGTRALVTRSIAQGLPAVSARLFTVYGPGEHGGRLLPSLIAAARSAEVLPLTAGSQTRDFTYVGDVADGLLRLGLAPVAPGTVANLATGRLTPVRTFVQRAAVALQIPFERLQFGALPTRPDEMPHEGVDIARLRRLTSWEPPTTIDEGIRQTLDRLRPPG